MSNILDTKYLNSITIEDDDEDINTILFTDIINNKYDNVYKYLLKYKDETMNSEVS